MDLIGLLNWSVDSLLPVLGVFLILAIALNIQSGYTGVINFGVVAFFMVGAYASAIFTVAPAGMFQTYIGGFELPVLVGWLIGMLVAGVLALLIALPVIRLREDFLAIVTIGVAEILRTVVNASDIFNRGEGINRIPGLGEFLTDSQSEYRWLQLAIMLGVALAVWLIVYLVTTSPWGRVLRGLRDSEQTATFVGKHTTFFKLQSFVLGAMIMGLAGGVYAQYISAISPSAFSDLFGTFLVWTMLIVGGLGRPLGVIVGVVIIGTLWFGVSLLQSYIPVRIDTQYIFGIRHLLVGALIILFILYRPNGILPELPKVSRFLPKRK